MNLYDVYHNNKVVPFESINKDVELAQHIQIVLVTHKLLQPPADGKFGLISKTALNKFQQLLNNNSTCLDKQLAELLIETKPNLTNTTVKSSSLKPVNKIIDYCISKNYKLFTKPGEVNIIYLEGCNSDFTLNADAPNLFNDLRLIVQFIESEAIIVHKVRATTEPGNYYTYNPMNPNGAARLAFGQHLNAWQVGTHLLGKRTAHEALVQVAPVAFYRDRNKDFMRSGDKLYSDVIGMNHHASWGHGGSVGRWSAGCLCSYSLDEHKQFMQLCKQDPNYLANRRFRFSCILLDASKLFT